ncbi:MliC family protein [Fluviicola sp.]|uniref:MliC family protein n=1 Tax=Fluviicola sp. TaxID=1917219 RepID=UPI0031D5D310
MKQLISGIALTLVLGACAGNTVMNKNRHMEFDCSNDFHVVFTESITITASDSTGKITVKVKSPELNRKFDMKQVRAASGVKYASKDEKYIFWEHQGEFKFGTEDSTYCLCD